LDVLVRGGNLVHDTAVLAHLHAQGLGGEILRTTPATGRA
jgi:hypothetical protein